MKKLFSQMAETIQNDLPVKVVFRYYNIDNVKNMHESHVQDDIFKL